MRNAGILGLVGVLSIGLTACGVSAAGTGSGSSKSASDTGNQSSESPTKAKKAADANYPAAPQANWWPAKNSKYIYLTLDDGPGPQTGQILDVLKKHKVKATFFVIGKMVRTREALLQRVIDEGHGLGNHTYDHANLAQLSAAGVKDQLLHAAEKIGPEAGACFRPPYGALNDRARQVASSVDMQPVLWTIDTDDWSPSASVGSISAQLRKAHPGSVVLMHDGGGDRTATAAALDKVIPELQAKGYQFATVPICMPGTREPIS